MNDLRSGDLPHRMPGRAVFVDPTGRRRRRFALTTVIVAAFLLAVAIAFTFTLFRIVALPHVTGLNTRLVREAHRVLPAQPIRSHEQSKFVELKARQKLLSEIEREALASRAKQARAALLQPSVGPVGPVICGAFYAVWQET